MRQIPRLTSLGVAIALLIGLFAPARPANAAGWDEVEFVGSGWGHGVGMSQYGAYAMATLGYDYREILGYYYKGTSIGQVASTTTLWVNLERNRQSLGLTVGDANVGTPGSNVTITWEGGGHTALRGGTIAVALTGTDGCTVTVTNPGVAPVAMVDPATCAFDFNWYDWAAGNVEPSTKIVIDGCALTDWNATPSQSVPCQYARGMLHLRSGPGGLDLSAEMLMDDYIRGISEMPYYWDEIDALKAQAVAARSYAEARRIARGNPASNGCDGWCHVKDTPVDQRYVGWGHSNTGPWLTATTTTARQIVTHPQSSLGVVTAYYSSSTGGATEHGHVVGYSSTPVEWLTSVDDSWAIDGTVWNPNASWTVIKPADWVAARVGLDSLTSIDVIERRPGSNSVAKVEFRGLKDGDFTSVVKTGAFMTDNSVGFGLKSQYFDVEFRAPGDEMLFYRSQDGEFRYYDVAPIGDLSAPILEGSGYSTGWSSVTSILVSPKDDCW